jgi:hypothetical protein
MRRQKTEDIDRKWGQVVGSRELNVFSTDYVLGSFTSIFAINNL